MTDTKRHKLAATLFADIQGYTALMERDEAASSKLLAKFREVLARVTESQQGTIVNFYGDGCLLLFDSPLQAIRCAVQAQEAFRQEPSVPVRMGLHSGMVAVEGDHVYGDSVNKTSRIESMGVAGSILVSEAIQGQLKNHRTYQFADLGSFRFKNVEDPVRVYALDQPGLAIPDRTELKGKFASASPPSRRKYPWALAILPAALLLLIAWQFGVFGSAPEAGDPARTTKQALQSKRVAVLPFENQTMDEELDVYGNMISDWVTRGLMDAGEANIVNAANIETLLAEANLGRTPNPAFTERTGVDLVVQGRYYQTENRLIVVAHVLDVATGTLVNTFQLERPSDKRVALLDELIQELVGYWSVKESIQHAANPPRYDAYQEWMKGLRMLAVDAEQAVQHMEATYALDTNFYDPLFRLISLHYTMGDYEKASDILQFLEERRSSLTQFERLQFNYAEANFNNDYLRAAKVNEELARLDPSDARANYNIGYFYTLSHRPQQAIDALEQFDQRLLERANPVISWRYGLMAAAHFRLGNFREVLAIEESYPFQKIPTPLAVITMQSMIRMDSLHLLEMQYGKYQRQGVFSPVGTPELPDILLICICNELYLTGKKDALTKYNGMLEAWLADNQVAPYPHLAPDVFNNRPFRQAEAEGYVHYYRDDFMGALTKWQGESIPASNWPDAMERASRLGVCHAHLGDTAQARQQWAFIEAIDLDHPHLLDTKRYYQSRITAHLGDHDEAVDNIRESIAAGLVYFRPYLFHADLFLKPLAGYAPYEAVVQPVDSR